MIFTLNSSQLYYLTPTRIRQFDLMPLFRINGKDTNSTLSVNGILSIPDISEGESGAEYGKTPAYNPNAAP